MTAWASDTFQRLAAAHEVDLVTVAPDGDSGRPVVVWTVSYGEGIYLRSYRATAGLWYRRLLEHPIGRISHDELTVDVTFEHIGDELAAEINSSYWAKYGDLPTYVRPMVDAAVIATTMRIVPRNT